MIKFDKETVYKLFVRLLLVFTPAIVLLLIVYLFGHQSLWASRPYWSDEFMYWHEVFSFIHRGINAGFYTFNELTPRILSFGTHGFGTILTYSFFGAVCGWKYYSIVFANTIMVSGAFAAIILINKPATTKLLQLILLYATFLPLLLYATSSMSELLNYAVVILYFSLLAKALQTDNFKILFRVLLGFTIYICFIRVIYVVLLFPVFYIPYKHASISWIRVLIYSVISALAIYSFNSIFVSPYPYAFLYKLMKEGGVSHILFSVLKHLFLNIIRFVNPKHDDFLQIFQRYLFVLVMAWTCFKSNVHKFRLSEMNLHYVIAFFVLVLTWLINCAAYDVFDYHDYRVLSPVLFGIILFIVLTQKDKVGLVFIVANILSICIFTLAFGNIFSFSGGKQRYTVVNPNSIFEHVTYTTGAKNNFDNTIVIDNLDNATILNIPAGIGITYSDKISDKLQSKYFFALKQYKDLENYKKIVANPQGFLYKKTE